MFDQVVPTSAMCPMRILCGGMFACSQDMLFTIEAMKMETAIHAERDGKVSQVVVAPSAQVDAKDLLLVYEG